MGLQTAERYVAGLADGWDVHYAGAAVDDVVAHPEIGVAAHHAALEFRLTEDERFRDLAVDDDPEARPSSAFFRIPRSAEDLVARAQLIETLTDLAATLVVLVKEAGSDALFGLLRALRSAGDDEGRGRVEAFLAECRREDLALAVAQTDAKGDRSRRPSELDDPDLYVRVVDRTSDGVVVRGAKVHTSCAPYADRIVVFPGRRMGPKDADWSVAFAVPVATPGLRLFAADFLAGSADPFARPVSSEQRMLESVTVFDDVLVPWDHVFFHDRPDLATAAALAFAEYHRFTAVSYKLPYLHALVGAAVAVARAHGIGSAGHVRDKLTWLAGYAETVRGLVHLAALRCLDDAGMAVPDPFTTNVAKWTFARGFHEALSIVQDLAGGLLVTGPSGADWHSPEVRPVLEKYLAGAWPARHRLAVMNLVADLSAGLYGGYQAVLAAHAEGSIEAE